VENISKTSVIIVAAGKGKRMGRDYNKQYIQLEAQPIVAHTIKVFEEMDCINEIILVVGAGEVEFLKKSIIEVYGFQKVSAIVEGGLERRDSVYNGLKAVSQDCSIVLIHDGARPLITKDIIEESIIVAKESGACIAAVPVKDTIKISNDNMEVIHTPKRDNLWSVQTPQTFQYDLILEAYNHQQPKDSAATDDAMILEALGHTVKIIHGSYNNIKITTPEDLIVAEEILKTRREGR